MVILIAQREVRQFALSLSQNESEANVALEGTFQGNTFQEATGE
jgi:hypothetical protein